MPGSRDGIEIKRDLRAVIFLVANVAAAAQFSSGGKEVREVLRKIKAVYTYNHKHDGALIAAIMKFFAAVDEQHDRTARRQPRTWRTW